MAAVLCSTSKNGIGKPVQLNIFPPGCFPAWYVFWCSLHLSSAKTFRSHNRKNGAAWSGEACAEVGVAAGIMCQGMDEERLYLSGWCLGICEIQMCPFRSDTLSTGIHCSFFKSQTLWSVKWLESNIFVQLLPWSFLKKFCWVLCSCFCFTIKNRLVLIEVYSEMTYSASQDSWLYLSFALFPGVWSSGRILQQLERKPKRILPLNPKHHN